MFAEPSPKTARAAAAPAAVLRPAHLSQRGALPPRDGVLRHSGAQGNAWQVSPLIEELKPLAREAGLWNMFLPHEHRHVPGISNLDYAPLCEVMGRVSWSGEVFNCSAPDTGNMETLERYATEAQKERSGWSRCWPARSARAS
jgi:acyl-CoA dehydrogenase